MRFSDRQLIQKFSGILGGFYGVALVLANYHFFAVNRDDPFVIAGVSYGVMLLHRALLSFAGSTIKGAGGFPHS